jgi:hypothetical protein
MSKFIVCLGYRLPPDNSFPAVLENRLLDAVKLCRENNGSTLLLMGAKRYGDLGEAKISEARAMKEYLEQNFGQELKRVKVLTEESTVSAMEQICYLKKLIEKEKINFSDVVIVSSQFFTERIKLYAEYVFSATDGIIFIGSLVPQEIMEEFKEAEEQKLKDGINWLKSFKKGDDRAILKAQKDFQAKVLKGQMKQPPIS